MLEYSYDEATELLTKNLVESTEQLVRAGAVSTPSLTARSDAADALLVHCCSLQADLQKRQQFIRGQITTAQVSTSRLFNWDQQRRRKVRCSLVVVAPSLCSPFRVVSVCASRSVRLRTLSRPVQPRLERLRTSSNAPRTRLGVARERAR